MACLLMVEIEGRKAFPVLLACLERPANLSHVCANIAQMYETTSGKNLSSCGFANPEPEKNEHPGKSAGPPFGKESAEMQSMTMSHQQSAMRVLPR